MFLYGFMLNKRGSIDRTVFTNTAVCEKSAERILYAFERALDCRSFTKQRNMPFLATQEMERHCTQRA